jgi:hypothetical protein
MIPGAQARSSNIQVTGMSRTSFAPARMEQGTDKQAKEEEDQP